MFKNLVICFEVLLLPVLLSLTVVSALALANPEIDTLILFATGTLCEITFVCFTLIRRIRAQATEFCKFKKDILQVLIHLGDGGKLKVVEEHPDGSVTFELIDGNETSETSRT